jgi:hypothetical protein
MKETCRCSRFAATRHPERRRTVRDQVQRALADLTLGRARHDTHRQVEAVNERDVERVLGAAVAVHGPLGDRGGRNTRARVLVAQEAAVAAAGLALNGRALLGKVALGAPPQATRRPGLGHVELNGRAGLLLPPVTDRGCQYR